MPPHAQGPSRQSWPLAPRGFAWAPGHASPQSPSSSSTTSTFCPAFYHQRASHWKQAVSSARSSPVPALPRSHRWLFGSSEHVARLAARRSMPYVSDHHFKLDGTREAFDICRTEFRPSTSTREPKVILTATVVADITSRPRSRRPSLHSTRDDAWTVGGIDEAATAAKRLREMTDESTPTRS